MKSHKSAKSVAFSDHNKKEIDIDEDIQRLDTLIPPPIPVQTMNKHQDPSSFIEDTLQSAPPNTTITALGLNKQSGYFTNNDSSNLKLDSFVETYATQDNDNNNNNNNSNST